MEADNWNINIPMPDGKPIWEEAQRGQIKKKRLRGKQSAPEYLHARIEVAMPKESKRSRPTHKVARAATEFSAEEQDRLDKMEPRMRNREEKRIMHNRTATEKGLHYIEAFKGNETATTCAACKKRVTLTQKCKGEIVGINWNLLTQYFCLETEAGKQRAETIKANRFRKKQLPE